MNNFVPQFWFCYFCSAIFVPQFLFHYFCSTIFVPLFLFHYFCSTIFVLLTFLHLHLGSPSPNGKESLPIFVLPDRCYPFKVQTLNEQSLWNIPFYTHLIFVLQFLFCYFCSAIFVPQFLFHYFCSAIFVLLTFLHLLLGSPSPNGQQCPPIFVLLTFLNLHCPHQFLFG